MLLSLENIVHLELQVELESHVQQGTCVLERQQHLNRARARQLVRTVPVVVQVLQVNYVLLDSSAVVERRNQLRVVLQQVVTVQLAAQQALEFSALRVPSALVALALQTTVKLRLVRIVLLVRQLLLALLVPLVIGVQVSQRSLFPAQWQQEVTVQQAAAALVVSLVQLEVSAQAALRLLNSVQLVLAFIVQRDPRPRLEVHVQLVDSVLGVQL